MNDRPDNRFTVGPYRITGLLGAGGMGKVYLARDERLDRNVAVKCLEKQDRDPEALSKRFRREARLTAGLNHPNIVAIYDILEQDGSDYLVMEYVKGATLKQYLTDRRPEMQTKLDIVLQILAGLAAAHGDGVVHRDLKSENILIADNGVAKIADFGIARSLRKIPDAETLTGPRTMLGTYRCMSPEQARGEPADAASDFFSLGVLCYEVFTGQSPFTAENELATLHRIINHQQRPMCELNPEIPLPLSQLADHLLQKDSHLRPRNPAEIIDALKAVAGIKPTDLNDAETAAAVVPLPEPAEPKRRIWPIAVISILVLGTLALALLRRSSSPPPIHVVVVKPQIIGSVPEADLLGRAARLALVRTLLSLEGMTTLPASQVDRLDGSPIEIAKSLAADEVVTAELDGSGPVWMMTLNRIRGADGILLWTDRFEVPRHMETAYARSVSAHLLRGYDDYAAGTRTVLLEVRDRDYIAYLETHKRFYAGGRKAGEEMSASLTRIHAGSPHFLDAYLLAVNVALARYNETGEQALLDRAYAAAREARLLAPNEPEPVLGELECAFVEGDVKRIMRLIEILEEIDPGSVPLLVYQARLHERENRPEQALKQMRAAVARHPSWRRLYSLARMELRLGRIDASIRTLDRLLERAPDSHHGQALAAQVELVNGDPEKAAALYEKIVSRTPRFAELNNLALARFLSGEYDLARETFNRARDLAPDNPFACLNLADATLLAGRTEEARELYRTVLDLVNARVKANDGKETDWQLQSVRAQALAHLGQSREAVASIQAALALAPTDSQAAYEAAVVFAVLDERASAAFQAQRALDLGYQPRWFTFPWFDALRKDPRFDLKLDEPDGEPVR